MIGDFLFQKRNRIKTPTRIQMEAAECGSTALNIVLSYYKKFGPSAELRYRCGVSRDGSDAYNMVEAAKYYGLDSSGYRASFEEIKKNVKAPAILHWEQNHFVVYEGFDDQNVYINDPATGERLLTHEEFKAMYSDVVLTFKPTKTFKPGGEAPRFFSALFDRLRGYLFSIFGIVIIQLILVITGVAIAIFSQVFIDEYLIKQRSQEQGRFLLFFLSIIGINALAIWLQGYLFKRMERKITISLSSKFLWHVLRLPISFFMQRFGGEVISRTMINNRVSLTITGQFGQLFINISVFILYAIIIWQYDPVMAVVAMIITTSTLLLIEWMNRLRMNAYARSEQDRAKMTGNIIDTLANFESTAAVGSEQFSFQKILGYFSKVVNRQQYVGEKDTILNTFAQFSTQFASIAVLAIGGWRVMFGTLTIGMLVTLKLLIRRLMIPLKQFSQLAMMEPTLRMDLQRLDDVLDQEMDPLLILEEKTKTP